MRARIGLFVIVATVACACGTLKTQEKELPHAIDAFCRRAAQVAGIVGRTYNASTYVERDLRALRSARTSFVEDAETFDSIPAIDTDIPNFVPVARRMRESLTVLTRLLDKGGTRGEAAVASADVLDSLTTIPRAGCAGTALDSVAIRTPIRNAAAKVGCRGIQRVAATRETPGEEKFNQLLRESVHALEISSRLFSYVGERRAPPVLMEFAAILSSWRITGEPPDTARLKRASQAFGRLGPKFCAD